MLEKANTPDVGPAGGPTGRHTKSPVEVQKPDPFAYEGGGLESRITPNVGPIGGPTGRHTKSPVVIQKPDVFGNVK